MFAFFLAAGVVASAARMQAPPAGEIVPAVVCAADASQSYALYVPSRYTPARAWPVILAFDPGARGRTPVERYREAAERYGFIVAGSNNVRNGFEGWSRSAAAMANDVAARFNLDARRVYMAGMSGGARLAMDVALRAGGIAGVVASSAGFPDATPRKSLPFVVFATAGTEDFNHLEMRLLDRELTTPHRLAVFEGGHTWLSSELAMEAVEWLEIQAMRSGIAPRDQAAIDRIFASRLARVDPSARDAPAYVALQAIVADFDGLEDVSGPAARVAALADDKAVRNALKIARDEDNRELRILNDIRAAQVRLSQEEARSRTLAEIEQTIKSLGAEARRVNDSADRRVARRVLAALGADPTTDAALRKMIAQYRLPRER